MEERCQGVCVRACCVCVCVVCVCVCVCVLCVCVCVCVLCVCACVRACNYVLVWQNAELFHHDSGEIHQLKILICSIHQPLVHNLQYGRRDRRIMEERGQ